MNYSEFRLAVEQGRIGFEDTVVFWNIFGLKLWGIQTKHLLSYSSLGHMLRICTIPELRPIIHLASHIPWATKVYDLL